MNLPTFNFIVVLSMLVVVELEVYGFHKAAYSLIKYLITFYLGIAVKELVL